MERHMGTKEFRAIAARLASAVLWQEHFEQDDSPECARAELEQARDLASQLIDKHRSVPQS
jgi:hypothetical protein